MESEWVQSTIKLSIGILVSNRIGTIRKCMDSLVPLLQAVPGELIALDTVGELTDGSINVVQEYTDKVYRYEWHSDFADARNTCLSYAKGEWFLFLDDDEWFDHVEDLVSFFQTGEQKQYGFGMFLIRNYDASGNYSDTIATRMIRRKTDTHFVGRIHEKFHELSAPGKQFESFLHHSGYVFANEEEKKKHQERNISILKQDLAESGMTARSCAQMAQELLFCQDTAKEGFDYCMTCLPKLRKQGALMDSCVQWIIVASIRYFHTLDDYENLKNQVEYIKAEYPLSQMAELAISGVMLEAAVKAYDFSVIPQLAEHYLEKWDWLKTHPEEAMAQSQLDFPKYYNEDYLIQMLQAGAAAANAAHQYETAYRFWKRIPWEKQGFDGSRYQKALLETLRGMSEKQPLISYYRHFYKEEWFLKENRGYLPKECKEALEIMENDEQGR